MTKITLFFVAFICATTSYAQMRVNSNVIQADVNTSKAIDKHLTDYELFEIDLEKFTQGVSSSDPTDLTWDLGGLGALEMAIEPDEIRSLDYAAYIVNNDKSEKVEVGETITYKGHLTNESDLVRFTIDEGFVYGGIMLKGNMIYIRQLRTLLKDFSIPKNQIIVYRHQDVIEIPGGCGMDESSLPHDIVTSGPINKNTSAGCNILEMELHCDPEYFYTYFGSGVSVFTQMISEINLIQDVYDDDLETVLSITGTLAFQSGGYTSTDPSGVAIIQEIRNQYNSASINNDKDFVHLFSGKNLVGGLLGRASWFGDICNHPQPVCFTIDRVNCHETVAHEIGHLLDGRHGDGANCGTPFVRTTMCQGLNKSLNFSPNSITRITNFMNNENCLDINSTSLSGIASLPVGNSSNYWLTDLKLTAGTTINWTLSNSNATIVSGQGTGWISVQGVSNGNVTVSAEINYPGTECGSVTETMSVSVFGGSLAVNAYRIQPSYSNCYAYAVGGSAPYVWSYNGTTILTTTSSSTFLSVGCLNGTVTVQSAGMSASDPVPSCSGFDVIGKPTKPGLIPGPGDYEDEPSFTFTRIYPNPTSNDLTLEINNRYVTDQENSINVYMYDVSGKLVQSLVISDQEEKVQLDVSALKSGCYFMVVQSNHINEKHKLVIK